ncbi:MAG: CinA family protein [Gammaproteobacteria bacterium]
MIDKLVIQLGERLKKRQLMLATAESCTGGLLAQVVTSIPGSSSWFERGFVTYSNTSKVEMLGVSLETISRYGAVSEQTVCEMAKGALIHSHAQMSVAISGIAGPGGEVRDKPVGTVWLAWSGVAGNTHSVSRLFDGDREKVRFQAVCAALEGLISDINQWY